MYDPNGTLIEKLDKLLKAYYDMEYENDLGTDESQIIKAKKKYFRARKAFLAYCGIFNEKSHESHGKKGKR